MASDDEIEEKPLVPPNETVIEKSEQVTHVYHHYIRQVFKRGPSQV